jgi:hypothetical protein
MVTRADLATAQAKQMNETGPGGLDEHIGGFCKNLNQAGRKDILWYHTLRSEGSNGGFPDWAIGSTVTKMLIIREGKKVGQHPRPDQEAWLALWAANLRTIGSGPGAVPAVAVWTPQEWYDGTIQRELQIVAGILPVPR